ncbi:MAG: tetratricopeptide repeat protein [Saprospiraceae bacterium]|nr:tetratricopeptide repeat protein [Saprospiraceae bacterium]
MFDIKKEKSNNSEGNQLGIDGIQKKVFYLNGISYLIIILLFSILLYPLIVKKKSCILDNKNVGILISNFSKSDEDEFSYKIFNLLEDKLQNKDTINTLRVDKFINLGFNNYRDTILNIFSKNCHSKGLFVYGRRSVESQYLDCNIYINKLFLSHNKLAKIDRNVIFLQNPSLMTFSIDQQAELIVDFILALLFYNSNDIDQAIHKFKYIINDTPIEVNSKLKSYCQLFLGNIYFSKNNLNLATSEYKMGLKYDSINPYIHFNLGITYFKNLDTIAAFEEFNTANQIDNKIINPLAWLSIINASNTYSHKIIGENKININTQKVNYSHEKIKQIEINSPNPKSIDTIPFAIISNLENKFGVIDNKQDTILPCIYDSIIEYKYKGNTFFIVEKTRYLEPLMQTAHLGLKSKQKVQVE